MKKRLILLRLIPVYALFFSVMILIAILANSSATAVSDHLQNLEINCVVIDPGHGGIDGGATSYNGSRESTLNLQIAERLNDALNFLGINTIMTRNTDRSIHTEGASIAQKKVSDLKQRVKIVNEQKNAVLISIHQNHFSDSQYFGPQVFYSKVGAGKTFAKELQNALNCRLGVSTGRKAKAASGIYLMDHIDCTGILVECGFLSNPEEEAKLTSIAYQIRLSCVIATECAKFLNHAAVS